MKRKFTFTFFLFMLVIAAFGNGVAIVDANQAIYFQLLESHVDVTVNNQISVTKAAHIFKNTSGSDTKIMYAFPLSEGASMTNLRWYVNGVWTTATLIAAPQDTTLPTGGGGSTVDADLQKYLGATPLYFKFNDVIGVNDVIIVELTYVELLKYSNNFVQYSHPNDYSLIQTTALDSISFDFGVTSAREILSMNLFGYTTATVNLLTYDANLHWHDTNFLAISDYLLDYELNPNQLGLVSFSTFLPNSASNCDTSGNGYFALIIEPDGTDSTAVIEKVFTLIIDVSGSMSGDKIVQARDAATFIVNNMNFGDKFNIVKFSSSSSSWKPNHVDFNAMNQTSALNYISLLNANGGTSFTSAFNTAIPQFNYDTTVSNTVIFLTDGLANESDNLVMSTLSGLVTSNNLGGNIQIHTFGIGDNINQSLLSQIATQYDGVASFVGNNDLYAEVAMFYTYIQNPVLLNVQAAFSPSMTIAEIYPNPLPNLYKGQQMIVIGRYSTPDSIQATFSGQAFGNPISFQYGFTLTDSLIPEHQFLTKIWAKMKIENLMRQYYNAGTDTMITAPIKNEVTTLSLCYGVVSPFTSYYGYQNGGGSGTGNGGGGLTSTFSNYRGGEESTTTVRSAHVFPNPFHSTVRLSFSTSSQDNEMVLKIYDSSGKIIRIIQQTLDGFSHQIIWDGTNDFGGLTQTGTYIYSIEINGRQEYLGKILKVE